jgi:hypothetical protein
MADGGANEANQRAPWTIKAVDVETRRLAVRCATRRGLTMPAWLETAVRNQASIEAGDQVILPEKPGQTPALIGQTTAPAIDLGELARAVQAAQEIATAAGVAVPKDIARHTFGLLRARLRDARGLPPRMPRKPRQTTIDHEANHAEGA